MPCNSSPAPASKSSRKKSTMERKRDFALPDADAFNQNNVEPGCFAKKHRLARAPGHPANVVARGRRADEGARFAAENFHARLVAQNAAAGEFAGRINGQHRHRLALADEVTAEGFDEGAFADTRRAGDADPLALPVCGNNRAGLPAPSFRAAGDWLSISVTARERIPRSPARTPATYSSIVGSGGFIVLRACQVRERISLAASGMQVPGPKTAAAPFSFRKS